MLSARLAPASSRQLADAACQAHADAGRCFAYPQNYHCRCTQGDVSTQEAREAYVTYEVVNVPAFRQSPQANAPGPLSIDAYDNPYIAAAASSCTTQLRGGFSATITGAGSNTGIGDQDNDGTGERGEGGWMVNSAFSLFFSMNSEMFR